MHNFGSLKICLLVDLTMQIETTSPGPSGTPPEREVSDDGRHFADEEQALPRTSSSQTPSHPSGSSQVNADLGVPRSRTRPSSIADSISAVTKNAGNGAGNYIKRKTSQLLDAISSGSTKGNGGSTMSPQLAALVQAYYDSDIANAIREEINVIKQRPEQTGESEATQTRDIAEESSNLRGRRRASYATQFRILSGRAFKNLYRNPALLSAHYISSIAIAGTSEVTNIEPRVLIQCAVICGFLFQNVT
jgi:ATP-binding cassette, subfamily G (WHITE), member 2